MALPTIPSIWTPRKQIQEARIVHARSRDNELREQWSHTADYFNKYNVRAAKQTAWTSNECYQESMDAYKAQQEKETKKEKLKQRRDRLSKLLKSDRDRYEAELKGLRGTFKDNLEEMKDRAESLRSAREEKRRQIADDKLYEHMVQNNPDIRQIESDLQKRVVINEWGNQLQNKEQAAREEVLERAAEEVAAEQERAVAVERQRQLEEERARGRQQLQNELQQQMNELKARMNEAEELKREQEELNREQWQLEELESIQRAREQERLRKQHGRMLQRQHLAKLRQRSHQVQAELEEDRKLLEMLAEQQVDEQRALTARREKARADAQWMKQVLEEQMQLEKAREAELDDMFKEEAARQWQKREAEWEREGQARQRLMNEVLAGRTQQVADKLESVRLQQEESLARREELLHELEIAQQLTRREEETKEKDRRQHLRFLDQQVTARRKEQQQAAERLQLELDDERQAEKDYDQMLALETARRRAQGPLHKNYGHRRQAWD